MYVVSISVDKRIKEIPDVQEILTKYGKEIVARLGLHGCEEDKEGLILIVYKGENIEEFVEVLSKNDNVRVNHMMC